MLTQQTSKKPPSRPIVHCLADPAVPCLAAIRTLILGAAANDDDAASIIISDDYRIILHRRD